MANVDKFTPTFYGQIETPLAPNPRLSASITSTGTTITLTSGILVQAGTKPTDPVIFGIRNRDTGYEELCYVTSANISSDGKTLSSVVRGIARSGETGVDLTTAVTANQSAHPQDSEVRVVVAPQIFQMMGDALRGSIASGGASWQIGLGTDVNITVYAANGDANKPYFQYNAATNQWVYSNDGVSSTPFGTGAGVTGGDGITVTAGDIDTDLTDTVIYKNARTGNEIRVPITAVGDGKLDKTFMPTYVEDLINSGTTVAEIDQALDGISANVTATNLNDLTDGTATTLHSHAEPAIVFVPAGGMTTGQNATYAKSGTFNYGKIAFADGLIAEGFASCKVPVGRTSITSIKVYYKPDGTGNLYLKFPTGSIPSGGGAPTEDTTDTLTTYATTTAATIDVITVPAAAYNGLTIAGNNIVYVDVYRDSNSATDTYGTSWEVVGVEFTFA